MKTINFESKPSKAKIVKLIKMHFMHHRASNLEFYWGENNITIEGDKNALFGYGWIGKISGQDIAHEVCISLTKV